MGRFITLNSETKVRDAITAEDTSIILYKKPQAGKTQETIDLALMFYKTSAIIYIQDKITGLEVQNMNRFRKAGFTVHSYRDGEKLGKILRESCGKKVIISILMEINNVKMVEDILDYLNDLPVTVFIDEADKNRSAIDADTKKKKAKKLSAQDIVKFDSEDDDEEDDVADGSLLPPVTLLLFQIKNLVKARENSRTIFVSATPQGILTAEDDNWVVIYKKAYPGHVCEPNSVYVNGRIVENSVKTRDRWTKTWKDSNNTFRPAVAYGVQQFVSAPNKCLDQEIQQVMLISLENRKIQQFLMAEEVKSQLNELGAAGTVGLVVMNSDTKTCAEESLASFLLHEKLSGKKKVIVIAGFMASRGVSFTEYSNDDHLFELILQVHYTKKEAPINSSFQAMRICGPKRKTVEKPALITNHYGAQDINVNFIEMHRIITELAEYGCATLGNYNPQRPVCQPACLRAKKQGWRSGPGQFLFPSSNPADHLPIVP